MLISLQVCHYYLCNCLTLYNRFISAPSQLNESAGLLFSLRSKTTSHTALQNGNQLNLFASTSSEGKKHKNGTESGGDHGESGSYSVALSVVVAIGLSMLILNLLVFAGVYYIDRHRERRNTNSCVNSSHMYSLNGAKHFEPNSLNGKSASSGSSTLTNINEHNEVCYMCLHTNERCY